MLGDVSLAGDIAPRIVFDGAVGRIEDDEDGEARAKRPPQRRPPVMEARA
jgi:hypothetical protein